MNDDYLNDYHELCCIVVDAIYQGKERSAPYRMGERVSSRSREMAITHAASRAVDRIIDVLGIEFDEANNITREEGYE